MYKIPDVPHFDFPGMFSKFDPRTHHAVSRIKGEVDIRLSDLENATIWGISVL